MSDKDNLNDNIPSIFIPLIFFGHFSNYFSEIYNTERIKWRVALYFITYGIRPKRFILYSKISKFVGQKSAMKRRGRDTFIKHTGFNLGFVTLVQKLCVEQCNGTCIIDVSMK